MKLILMLFVFSTSTGYSESMKISSNTQKQISKKLQKCIGAILDAKKISSNIDALKSNSGDVIIFRLPSDWYHSDLRSDAIFTSTDLSIDDIKQLNRAKIESSFFLALQSNGQTIAIKNGRTSSLFNNLTKGEISFPAYLSFLTEYLDGAKAEFDAVTLQKAQVTEKCHPLINYLGEVLESNFIQANSGIDYERNKLEVARQKLTSFFGEESEKKENKTKIEDRVSQ